ncbi:MAG: integral membrane protein MviN [Desulfatitalea sp. BRH_c12]|nr:MAG: integral membrane protein MviN [Desulfatitalea sp. BRH_c12]
MRPSVYRKIGVATLIMMVSIFLSRVLGVLRESILAAVCGAGTDVDAYKTAFMLPEILNHITASGFFSITFIPIFMRYRSANDPVGGWRIFSVILTVFGTLLAVLVLAAMLLAPQLLQWLAPGRTDPLFQAMAVRMTRILLPAQLCFFAGGIFMAVQFANERFMLPALAPLVYNLGIIIGGVLLAARIGVEGFAWGALGGALIGHLGLQMVGAAKRGMRFSPVFDWRHPDLRRYILLTLPLMFGLTMTFSTEIFSKFFGSFLPAGAITHIDFAWRIILMLVGFFGQAVGVAAYPFLARMAAERRTDEMNRLFNNTLRYLALVIPVSLLVFVLRHEIVRILFERYQFTAADTDATALALAGMVVGAVAFAAQTVVNRGFYAMQNTLLPALYSTVAVILSLPLYWIGLKIWGVLGIGLAISFSAIAQVLLLFMVWNRRSGNSGSRGVYRFYAKSLLISLPVTGVLMLTQYQLRQLIPAAHFLGSLLLIVLQSCVFLLLMAAATWAFNIDEARVLAGKILVRVKGGSKAV